MVKMGGIKVILVLFCVGLLFLPDVGSTFEARTYTKVAEDSITIGFFDCTAAIPQQKEIMLTKEEWNTFRQEIRAIRASSDTIEESLNAQFSLFKDYGFITNEVTYQLLHTTFQEKTKHDRFSRLIHTLNPTPIINNSVFNAMCAIDFEIVNGTTGVIGLNTFVNWIGFDIASLHYGYAQNGIDTKGLISRAAPAGQYAGFMFGFLGFWFGDMTLPAFYSNVTAAGFTVMTGWIPIPLF